MMKNKSNVYACVSHLINQFLCVCMCEHAHTPQPVCGETLSGAGNWEFLNFHSLLSPSIAYPHFWALARNLQMMIKNLLSGIPTKETGPRRKESGERGK